MALLVLLIALLVLWVLTASVVELVKDRYAKAKDARDDRIMAAYESQERARYHARNLAEIEQIRIAAASEMLRIAAETRSEVFEGTAVEVERL